MFLESEFLTTTRNANIWTKFKQFSHTSLSLCLKIILATRHKYIIFRQYNK